MTLNSRFAVVQAVLAAGAAEAVAKAMRCHLPTSPKVQAQGCGALGNMAGGDATEQRRVIEAGGAAAVVEAMRRWEEEGRVQQGGKAALANMAFGQEELREAVIAAGADPEWLGEDDE